MTSGKPLDEQYFEWLYAKVGSLKNRNPRWSHMQLSAHLYSTPFKYFVPRDDNRALDGLDLREQFLDETGADPDLDWMDLDCSVLEMLIALAKRAYFLTDEGVLPGGLEAWYGLFLENLGLIEYTDEKLRRDFQSDLEVIDRTITEFNNRTYKKNGQGGLFPLKRPDSDQTKVELWYQLNAYLLENNFVAV